MRVERDGALAVLTLDRPEVLNYFLPRIVGWGRAMHMILDKRKAGFSGR